MLGDVLFDIDKLFVARYNYKKSGEKYEFLDDSNSTVEERFDIWSKNRLTRIIKDVKENHETWLRTQEFESDFDLIAAELKLKADIEAAKTHFKEVSFESFKAKDEYGQNIREAIENRLLDCYIALLTSKHHIAETKASIDTVTGDMKDILGEIEGIVGKTTPSYGLYYTSPSYHMNKKKENVVSKNGIGPFALALVHHVLTQVYQIKITDSTLNALGMTDISGRYGNDGVRITDWLSAMINAHVDAAKDPYITRLNVIPYTYGVAALMLRSGIGGSTFFFLKQPIITDILDLVNNKPNISTNEIIKELSEKYGSNSEEYKKIFDKNYIYTPEILDRDRLTNMLKYKDENWNHNQLEVLHTFMQIKFKSKDLSDFVSVSQVDTKKFGNNLTALRMFEKRYNEFKLKNTENKTIFSDATKFFEQSFLDTKFKNSVQLIQNLFSDYLMSADPSFVHNETILLSSIGRSITKDEKLLDEVYNTISAVFRGKFFNGYINGQYKEKIMPLLYDIPSTGNLSLATRLFNIKDAIFSNKYPELLENGSITNTLLSSITGWKKEKGDNNYTPNLIKVIKSSNNQLDFTDEMIRGFEELLSSKHQELREFAQDLVLYSMYSHLGKPGLHSLFQYLPESVEQEIGYDKFGQNLEEELEMDDIFKNMWYSDKLVPFLDDYHIKDTALTTTLIPEGFNGKVKVNAPVLIAVKPEMSNTASTRPYVKVENIAEGEKVVLLYKRIATINYYDNGEAVYSYVYALSKKKGFKLKDRSFTEFTGNIESQYKFNDIKTTKGYNPFIADNVDEIKTPELIEKLFSKIDIDKVELETYQDLYPFTNKYNIVEDDLNTEDGDQIVTDVDVEESSEEQTKPKTDQQLSLFELDESEKDEADKTKRHCNK